MSRRPAEFVTEVHCPGCGKKIKKALMKIKYVDDVSFDVGFGENGRVYVHGNANAETVRKEIRRKNDGKAVGILDYGGFDVEEAPPRRSPPRASSPAPSSYGGSSHSNYPAAPPPTPQSSSSRSSSYYTPAYSPSPPRQPSSSSNDNNNNNYPPGGYYSYYAPPPPPPGGHYPPLANYYNYDQQSRGGPYYMPNYAPTTFNDENPNACSIQ